MLGFLTSEFAHTRKLNLARHDEAWSFAQSSFRQFQPMREGLCWQLYNNGLFKLSFMLSFYPYYVNRSTQLSFRFTKITRCYWKGIRASRGYFAPPPPPPPHWVKNEKSFSFVSSYYEGCSNMNASSFITFFTYMLQQKGKRFYKGLYVTFKLAPNLKKNTEYLSSYSLLNDGHVSILTNSMLRTYTSDIDERIILR